VHVTWIQNVRELLEEVADSYGRYDYREANQLHREFENRLFHIARYKR
jgi:hypothetical protein